MASPTALAFSSSRGWTLLVPLHHKFSKHDLNPHSATCKLAKSDMQQSQRNSESLNQNVTVSNYTQLSQKFRSFFRFHHQLLIPQVMFIQTFSTIQPLQLSVPLFCSTKSITSLIS